MEKTKMRSRLFPDLTNWEIEEYLKRNNVIIVPVGNNEVHGGLPVDCEFVAVDGYARLIAEEVDGLVLPNLDYFNPGGTQTGRGTVHMSMTDSFNYCLALAHSLLNQGFTRQIWIPSHGPTAMFLLGMITQFFDETKVPALFLQPMTLFSNLGITPKFKIGGPREIVKTKDGDVVDLFNDGMLGAYKICGRLNIVPAKGEVDFPPAEVKPMDMKSMNSWFPEYDLLMQCSDIAAPAPFYYSHANDHGGAPVAQYTREELEKRAAIGEAYMRELVEAANFPKIVDALGHLGDFMKNTVVPNHVDHLPKSRFN